MLSGRVATNSFNSFAPTKCYLNQRRVDQNNEISEETKTVFLNVTSLVFLLRLSPWVNDVGWTNRHNKEAIHYNRANVTDKIIGRDRDSNLHRMRVQHGTRPLATL